MSGSIKNQVKIPPYSFNSSISAQSTVRFGSIFINAHSSGEKPTIFVNLYAYTDNIMVFLREEDHETTSSLSNSLVRNTIESDTLT